MDKASWSCEHFLQIAHGTVAIAVNIRKNCRIQTKTWLNLCRFHIQKVLKTSCRVADCENLCQFVPIKIGNLFKVMKSECSVQLRIFLIGIVSNSANPYLRRIDSVKNREHVASSAISYIIKLRCGLNSWSMRENRLGPKSQRKPPERATGKTVIELKSPLYTQTVTWRNFYRLQMVTYNLSCNQIRWIFSLIDLMFFTLFLLHFALKLNFTIIQFGTHPPIWAIEKCAFEMSTQLWNFLSNDIIYKTHKIRTR